MKKIIELKNITKSFDGEVVLDHIDLDIYDNEFLTLLGPSGCGKTTTLRLIGGFTTPDEGDIIFMGENINELRRISATSTPFSSAMPCSPISTFLRTSLSRCARRKSRVTR